MANKKILICAALATGLLVTACVKKEEPKTEDQQEQAVETQQEQAEINAQLADGSLFVSNNDKAMKLSARLAEIDEQLLEKMERWEELEEMTKG